MDYDAEIRDLKRRVGELEGGFGFLTNQVRDVHRDLLGFQQATEQRFDGLENRMDRIEGKVDALPQAVAETMKEMLGSKSS